MANQERHKFCIIIGAGPGGLIQAAELLRQKVLQAKDIQILERNDDYGGVWKRATYPGAACDVFSCLYQVSWHRNPDWQCLFPSRSELIEYYKNFAKHYGLSACTSFGQHAVRVTWATEKSLWIVETKDSESRNYRRWTSRVLVQAVGTFSQKHTPAIAGLDRFKGEVWHAADWPEDYDFTNKTVAYVGTGPTLVQALPHMQAKANLVHVFCRSMAYCQPMPNFEYPLWARRAFRWTPALLRIYAFILASAFFIWLYFAYRPGSWTARLTERGCRWYLYREVSDEHLLSILTPAGRFGSKRPLVSYSGFFKALQKDNVRVINCPIVAMDEFGLIVETPRSSDSKRRIEVLERGEDHTEEIQSMDQTIHVQADVLIWGTGFKVQEWGGTVPTIGRTGETLREHWDHYPNTLYGTMTSGFPNLFFINGPNTTPPWASPIQGFELQAALNTKAIRHIHQRSLKCPIYSLEPRKEKEEAWTEAIKAHLNKLATSPSHDPTNYYLNKQGQNTFFWPWSHTYYWWKTGERHSGNECVDCAR
ncbi:FAD-binding monooxygenase BOA2 [Metarhizium brunneum]|uniref:FAD-binding monooxygenase BOA2 n=1 Tax=Metarhizium brunneum TaxID=500148 RepID=A0A7D5Z611_9HYPO|nr:FAD-binding monooxygenase BOA2 [Metarhizium brunneum]